MGISREDILFHFMKNKVIPSGDEMRERYPNIDVTELRARIINYQIEKYGGQLDHNINHIDNEKAWRQSKDRKYYRLHRRK